MNKHDYLVDNVNSKSPVDSDHEVRSTKMCSYQQDESTENCSFQQCDACGDGCSFVPTKTELPQREGKGDSGCVGALWDDIKQITDKR